MMFKRNFGFLLAAILLALTACQPLYAAECKTALATIFSNEGGFQKMRNDSGNWTGGKIGKGRLVGTKYGLCAATYPKEDIPNLTLAKAARYYERDFWGPLNLNGLKSQGLATTILDTGVNCGTGSAAILFGRARNILTGRDLTAPVDPVISKEDVEWANAYTRPKHQRVHFYLLFQALRSERYAAIAKRDPRKKQFLDDWLVRTWD